MLECKKCGRSMRQREGVTVVEEQEGEEYGETI
jgi:hypothetical protein